MIYNLNIQDMFYLLPGDNHLKGNVIQKVSHSEKY